LDVQLSGEKLKVLQTMAGEIERAGRCFITDGGFHPGLPAALVRYVQPQFDCMERAVVSSAINLLGTAMPTESTIQEFLGEFKAFQMEVCKEGRWQKVKATSNKDMLKIDFSPEYGRYYCAPMMLEELRPLPELIPGLKETGFYITDVNQVVNLVVFPLLIVGLQASRGRMLNPLVKFMQWSYKNLSRPPYGVALKVNASGQKDGKPKAVEVMLYDADGYGLTAIPVVATLKQYLDGSAKKPGLWFMGLLSEPQRLMQAMECMGVKVRTKVEIGYKTEKVLT